MRTEYLLEKEVDKVLDLLTPQNRLIMRVALHTGLRISDVLRLRKEQLKSRFWVTEMKTKKRKQIGLPVQLLSDLKKQAGKEWVFPGRDGQKPKTRQSVWKDIKRAQIALRMDKNVGTHSARKVYAVELMQRYGDFERVKRALNHSSDAVTMIYAMADHNLRAKNRRRRAAPGRKLS